MSTAPPIPPREDVGKEIWRLASTLSDEMQSAAIRKSRELSYDLTKGHIPLEETLINLTHNRDIILDAANTNKLAQLPLKLQRTLFLQVQKIVETLQSLVQGTDAILGLEDAVDDLTATVWQNNLHNLSDQILGFHQKMNALKSQETLIRRAHREAEEFQAESACARDLLQEVENLKMSSDDQAASIQATLDQASKTLEGLLEQEQRANALSLQMQQHDSACAQYLANAKAAAADVEVMANRTKSLETEIDTARGDLSRLNNDVHALLAEGAKTIDDSVSDAHREYDRMKTEAAVETAALAGKLDSTIKELTESTKAEVDATIAEFQITSDVLKHSVAKLEADTNKRLAETEFGHASSIEAHIQSLNKKTEMTVQELHQTLETHLADNSSEFKRLVDELDSLESRIRVSIERATGFTLFHSFQKRQIDLAKSKRLWGAALAATVIVSLMASGWFIWSLQFVKEYNAAFFLKLSISLPLIYAIAFCSVQYSRERRLEEEYAFKSNISISLEPYQKLVAQLVDKEKPEELSKYTAFIIDSVSRVFTSPTEPIFGDHSDAKNLAPKTIKAVGELIEPLLKGLKK